MSLKYKILSFLDRIKFKYLLLCILLLIVAFFKIDYNYIKYNTTPREITNYDFNVRDSLEKINLLEQEYPECVLKNNVTRETWYVMNDEHTTDGKFWEMYEKIEPHGFVNVEHTHPYQLEKVSVVYGEVCLTIDNIKYTISKGQTINVPAGISHGLENPHNKPVLMRVEYYPALTNMTNFFQSLSSLSQNNKLWFSGITAPLETISIWNNFKGLSGFKYFPEIGQSIFYNIGKFAIENLFPDYDFSDYSDTKCIPSNLPWNKDKN